MTTEERKCFESMAECQPNELTQRDVTWLLSLVERLDTQLKSSCADWAADHSHAQEACRKYLSEKEVMGDEAGVPSISDLVDMLQSKIERQAEEIQELKLQKMVEHKKLEAAREAAREVLTLWEEAFVGGDQGAFDAYYRGKEVLRELVEK